VSGTVATFVALVIFVLPGFITARVASRRRPAPTTLGDLELVLRALGYSLVIHAAFALTTWTPWLVRKLDNGHDWTNHVDALALFAAAVILAAWLLGLGLGSALDELQRLADQGSRRGTVALAVFHALGGQDVRDGFDYVFARRKQEDKDFIAAVHTVGAEGEQTRWGRYGGASYFGLSPQPHDLYLEEMWNESGEGALKPMSPKQGGWFAAESIRDIYFRELPLEDKKKGVTTRVGIAGFQEAMRQEHERVAAEIAEAIATVVGDPDDDDDAVDDAFTRALDVVRDRYLNAPPSSHTDVNEQYVYWMEVTSRLVELGATATALAAEVSAHLTARHIASAAEMGQLHLRVPGSPANRWITILDEEAKNLRPHNGTVDHWAFQSLIGLIVEQIIDINNAEWDFPDE
jgi:hypothetical protein